MQAMCVCKCSKCICDDLPDEVFEDLLKKQTGALVKKTYEITLGPTRRYVFNVTPAPTMFWIPLDGVIPPGYCDQDSSSHVDVNQQREKRKSEGLCVECGDAGECRSLEWHCRNGHGKIF